MKIAIKNPAPVGPNLEKWGDYHFGLSLARSLEKLGAQVVNQYWPNWDDDEDADLVILLRGKRRYRPDPERLSLMWVISHPATLLEDELRQYDMVYLASETHYQQIREISGVQADVARQCTDPSIFNGRGDDRARRGISFVANSRGIRRDMLSWAVANDAPIDVIGRHWNNLGLSRLVKSQYIDNSELPAFYRGTRLALNDHWNDMAHLGYINNRIFDCLACGTPILTDEFPELRSVCGDALLYASDKESFARATEDFWLGYPDLLEQTRNLWDRIGRDYMFDARAAQIWEWANQPRAARPSTAPATSHVPAVQHALDAQVRRAVDALRSGGVTRNVETLHIGPTSGGSACLFGNDNIAYLSAGANRGPWHVRIDSTLAILADKHFDLMVIENMSALSSFDNAEQADFPQRIAAKLTPSALVIVPDAAPHFDSWSAVGDAHEGYRLMRAPNA